IAGLAPSARLWYVSSPAAAPVTTALVLDALEATGSEVSRATVGSAVITQFELDAPTSAPRTDSVATFGGQLKLVAAVLPAAPIEAVFPVYLRWQTVVAGPEDLYVTLRLQDQGGHVLSEVGQPVMNETIFPTSAWSPGDWADATVQMALPPRTLPGTATLVAMISEAAGVGAQLGAWGTDGEFLGVQVVLGEVQVSPPSAPTGEPDCADSQTHQAGPLRACVDDVKPATVWSGDRLAVPVTWTAQQTLLEDMSIRWQLLDATGAPAQEQTTTLAAHPTSRWRTHDSYTVPYDLRVDPSLPATEYTLALNVLASDGEPLWAIDQVVKKIQVLPRERSFELPTRIAHPLDLTLGGVVHLRGFDLAVPDGSLQTLQPGDAISITLIWQGDGPTDLDYTVFAHLIGPDGNPYGQVDRFPANGAAPTSTWAPGQVVVDHLLLEVAAGAPQGAYQVVVGMYDALRGGRPPMVDGAGQRLSNDQLALPTALAVSGGQP
ncbi:MAG: hypothetical protein GX601_04015, partial [Anaerolineales bacterium]|nr:hypothetical protein [Anaerolineales bacterium]